MARGIYNGLPTSFPEVGLPLQWLVLVLVLSWGSLTMACQQVYKGGKVARGIHNGLSTSLQSQAAELTSMFLIPYMC